MTIKKLFTLLTIFMFVALAGLAQQTNNKKQTSKTEHSAVIHLTNTTFKQKVFDYEKNKQWKFAGDKPCIIDFYADWCGPCRMIAPTIEQIAKDYQGKIYVYKVNVDEQKELASAFGISSIPAILFCPKTEQPQMSTGFMNKTEFEKAIKEVLKIQ